MKLYIELCNIIKKSLGHFPTRIINQQKMLPYNYTSVLFESMMA